MGLTVVSCTATTLAGTKTPDTAIAPTITLAATTHPTHPAATVHLVIPRGLTKTDQR
jgi:hypothetical protein